MTTAQRTTKLTITLTTALRVRSLVAARATRSSMYPGSTAGSTWHAAVWTSVSAIGCTWRAKGPFRWLVGCLLSLQRLQSTCLWLPRKGGGRLLKQRLSHGPVSRCLRWKRRSRTLDRASFPFHGQGPCTNSLPTWQQPREALAMQMMWTAGLRWVRRTRFSSSSWAY